MKINSNTTTRDLELNSGVSTIDYTLSESTSYQPGFLVSLIHFLISKLRSKPKFQLTIDIKDFEEKELTRRFYDFYQLVTVLLFDDSDDGRVKFKSNVSIDNLRSLYREKLQIQEDLYAVEIGSRFLENKRSSQLEELRKTIFSPRSKSRLSKGFSFLIPCFDHLKEFQKSDYLYSGNLIKNTTDIEQWVKRLFDFHKLRLDPSGMHTDTLTHISIIVKELFHNTEDWAKTTFDNSQFYNPNLRTCYLSLYLEERLKKKGIGSIDAIDDYMKLVRKKNINDLQISNQQQIELFAEHYKISFFEISVFDTGPGMARRWLEKDYTDFDAKKENDAVLECFHKYVTSDISGLMTLRGQGLSRVIKIIGNIGFIRVHSGNVLLSRNFLSKNLRKKEVEDGLIEFNEQRVNRVEGTCVTILYPIIYSM